MIMMKDRKIVLPKDLFDKLNELKNLGASGWSLDWQNKAKYIMYQLTLLRDSDSITQEEFDYIHKTYLNSIGVISESNNEFFNFIINKNT